MALRFAVLMRMRLPGRCAAEQRRAEHPKKNPESTVGGR